MSVLGVFEEFFSEVVYPNRYLAAVVFAVLMGAALYVGWRLRWHQAVAGHPYLAAAIGAPALVVLSLGGYYTLSPLWERSSLCEDDPLTRGVDESTFEGADCQPPEVAAIPSRSPTTTGPAPSATPGATANSEEPAPTPTSQDAAFEPRVVREGTWVGADDFHFARGAARLIETEPGVFVVRFEDFSVRNGPDLFVYLSTSPDGLGDGSLNLGDLKATDGAFNYEVPPGTDVDQFASVIVWCRQFAVLFGFATLN
jgi:hypothetical protein